MLKNMRRVVTFFFFQAEDGIRDYKVTGVQTCALPIYAALAVLFLGLGERREATRGERAHVPLVVLRHAVEFVRHEGEGDVVGPVEVAQDLEESGPEPGMP